MKSFARARVSGAALAAMLIVYPVAKAQTARPGGAQSAQLLQQLQQLGSERTTLQTENDRMKKELESLRKERDQLKQAQHGLDERARAAAAALAQVNGQRTTTAQELEQSKAKLQELIAKFRETLQTLRQIETEATTGKQTLARRDRELQVCTDRNAALYQLNGEILTHFEHESAWSRLGRAEPFTQIKRVQLENMLDDYKGRADDQHYAPGDTRAPPPAEQNAAPKPDGHAGQK